METMTATETDRRIDELSKRVDFGFEQTDRRIGELSKRVDFGFEQTDKRIDDLRSETQRGLARVDGDLRELRSGIASMQRSMTVFFATTLGSIIAGILVTLLSHS